jgi:hypothetical protein
LNKTQEKKYIAAVKKSKRALKKHLIGLSYLEKIKRVIEMQKISAQLKKDKTQKIYIWKI